MLTRLGEDNQKVTKGNIYVNHEKKKIQTFNVNNARP